MSKDSQPATLIILVIIIIVALSSLVFFLEKKLTLKESGAPATSSHMTPPEKVEFDELIAIKGCLFDLGIRINNIEVDGYSIKVRTEKNLTEEQIKEAFEPLKDLGKLEFNLNTKLTAFLENTWSIEFIFKGKPSEAKKTSKKKDVKIAIIIDDIGQDMDTVNQLASIDADITFSVLPFLKESQKAAKHLHSMNREVLLHLPLEPVGKDKDPGAGAIFTDMATDKVKAVLNDDINNVPFIDGVNNHMGSKATQDYNVMVTILTDLKKRGLFFIDSVTTNNSICRKAAITTGIEFNERTIFLDNNPNEEYIKDQLFRLVKTARKASYAIAIGHPHPETIATLKKEIPKILDEGIEIVPVSRLAGKP